MFLSKICSTSIVTSLLLLKLFKLLEFWGILTFGHLFDEF